MIAPCLSNYDNPSMTTGCMQGDRNSCPAPCSEAQTGPDTMMLDEEAMELAQQEAGANGGQGMSLMGMTNPLMQMSNIFNPGSSCSGMSMI